MLPISIQQSELRIAQLTSVAYGIQTSSRVSIRSSRAVEEAMRLLKANPVDRRTTEPPPPTWGKRKAGGS